MTQVTQADREATVSLIRTAQLTGLTEYLTEIEDGCYDENFFVQAFAQAREQAVQEAVAPLNARIAELEAEKARDDRVLRASVPTRFKQATSPVGAVQSYIAELEEKRAKSTRPRCFGDERGGVMPPAALRTLADRMEREHPDNVDPAVAEMIEQLQAWREEKGYITIGRLR